MVVFSGSMYLGVRKTGMHRAGNNIPVPRTDGLLNFVTFGLLASLLMETTGGGGWFCSHCFKLKFLLIQSVP